MLTLAFVFQTLAIRKPQLDNGVYVYARTGSGVYPGFLSAIGFWASACAGNAFYWVLIMTTLSQLFPSAAGILGTGDTWPAFIVSSSLPRCPSCAPRCTSTRSSPLPIATAC